MVLAYPVTGSTLAGSSLAQNVFRLEWKWLTIKNTPAYYNLPLKVYETGLSVNVLIYILQK